MNTTSLLTSDPDKFGTNGAETDFLARQLQFVPCGIKKRVNDMHQTAHEGLKSDKVQIRASQFNNILMIKVQEF